MLAYIDYLLDRITMYRLALYFVIAILVFAVALAAAGYLTYSPWQILISTFLLLVFCFITNLIFSYVFEAPANTESIYITALILACILPPPSNLHDIPLLFWAGVLAMASKYMLAIRKKHLFNPAAVAVVLTALWLNQPANWWVGTSHLIPITVFGGILMIRKLRRYDMIFSFFVTSLVTTALFTVSRGGDLFHAMNQVLLGTSLFFFAFVMLTEPLTSPPTNGLQILYGGLVGILVAPQIHFGSIYSTPELALIVGNAFSYLVSPKVKERLLLTSTNEVATNVMQFRFQPSRRFRFAAGQYMEFTLPHTGVDNRGNRRYFTIASSPTEETVDLGVKFYPESSTFKSRMMSLTPNTPVMGGQLAGDFTLPKNPSEKVVFIAGGIGVTPFRSMVKYMSDTKQMRPTTLLYMNKTVDEIAYQEVFDEAALTVGIKTVYVLTDKWPDDWTGRTGFVNAAMIREEVPDFAERLFYLSGPHGMVVAMEKALKELGVKPALIKKDFFPGLV